MAPPSKRLDLQGIRGLAILSVLGFHFSPSHFPNGYLGVDQFFVLSGFLMCMLLTKAKNLPFQSLLVEFYTKRFKRILPLFYFVIFLAMIELNTVYPVAEITTNESSAAKAIVFLSNRERSDEENYFKLLSAGTDLFLHTWSLSVEFQFYFIVPFLFVVGEQFTGGRKPLYYLILSTASLLYHTVSPDGVAFNSVFARIWQFFIGVGVYMITGTVTTSASSSGYSLLENGDCQKGKVTAKERVDEENSRIGSIVKHACLFISVTVAFWPLELDSGIWRPFFTLVTGILMAVSRDDVFLSNGILNYLGDISYALYLVHWPMYEYVSAWGMTDNYQVLFACLLGAVLLAAVLHETFEKWYLALSNAHLILLIICFFTATVTMIHIDEIGDLVSPLSHNPSLDQLTANMTLDDAEKYNTLWSRRDLVGMMETGGVSRTSENERWCDYKGEEGPYKIAIFGNSYARNHMKMVIQECKHKAFNITTDAEKGCEPLSPATETCSTRLDNFERFVESAQPDFAFLLTRFFSIGHPFENDDASLKNDSIYLKMKSQLHKFLPNIKRKLFILDAIPQVNPKYLPNLVADLKQGKSREEINKHLIHEEAGCKRARIRHAKLMEECGSKCQLIDYFPYLYDNKSGQFRYFDEKGFSYFTIQLHMSPHGIELVRPVYTDICSRL